MSGEGSFKSMCVIGVCGCCSNGEDSVSSAMVGGRWRASWSLVLLAMLWSLSSEDCIEDCAYVSPSEGDTIMVGALLDCSELCGSISTSESKIPKAGGWECLARGEVSAASSA